MTSEVHNSGSEPAQLEPPELRLARFEDYSQIIKLESTHDMWTQSEQDWRAMWEANPLWDRLKKMRASWVLSVSGSMLLMPVLTLERFFMERRMHREQWLSKECQSSSVTLLA